VLDKIRDFVAKNQVMSAVGAAVGALALYAAYDSGGAGAGGFGDGQGGGGQGGGEWAAPQGGNSHEVVDSQGFDRPVRAMTIALPPGWQAQSQVRWDNVNGQCSTMIASPQITMRSADGREQIEVLPGFLVTTDAQAIRGRGSQPGDFCIIAIADSGESMVGTIIVPRLRAGAQLERVNQVPLTPEQQQTQANLQQMVASTGSQMRTGVYSLEAWLRHPDGTAEVLLVSGYFFGSPPVMAGVPPLVSNFNDQIISVRAAPERVPALLQTARGIVTNVQLNPEWQSSVEETRRVLTRPADGRGGGTRVARGGGGGSGGGGGFDMDRWREDQREGDIDQRERIDRIYEVERCYDPETGQTYEVSIHVGC
jgi:hypothetical protein